MIDHVKVKILGQKNSHRVRYGKGQSERRHSVTSDKIREIKYYDEFLSVYRKYKFSNYSVTDSLFSPIFTTNCNLLVLYGPLKITMIVSKIIYDYVYEIS